MTTNNNATPSVSPVDTDAERLTQANADLAHEIMVEAHDACGVYHTSAAGKIRRALDSRDAALREARDRIAAAERSLALYAGDIREVQQQRDDYRADHIRVHKDKSDLLDFLIEKNLWDEYRARSQPATPSPVPHSWYGPCDSLADNGECAECSKILDHR